LGANLRGKKCRILSLEGGGTKGAFQAGAFQAMVELIEPEELGYDVIAGASVGSLNGIVFASTEIGQEQEVSQKLLHFWRTIKADDAIAPWTLSDLVGGFFSKSNFFNNTPLFNYVNRTFQGWGGNVFRKYTITTVNVNTAETIRATESVGSVNIPKYIVASAAVPGIFPNSEINGNFFIDGGAVDNTNIRGGIERCREIVGDDDKSIIIDVMMTNPMTSNTWMDMSSAKSYTLYVRGDEIRGEYKSYYYLKDVIDAFPDVYWRYMIKPEESLPNYPIIALSFDRKTLLKTEQIGYNTARKQFINNKASFKELSGKGKIMQKKSIKLP
jgi:predicted patatin/cPLA2 family phospholipase